VGQVNLVPPGTRLASTPDECKVAGVFLALVGSLLAWQLTMATPQLSFHRTSLAEADFGDARLDGKVDGIVLHWPLGGSGWEPTGWWLEYAYTRYEYDNLAARNRDLHRVAAPVRWAWPGTFAHSFELRPVIATSSNIMRSLFARGTADDLMLHGRWGIERAPSGTGAGWSAGVSRDDAFGGEQVYPEAVVLWRTPAAELGLGWPRTWASYRPSATWLLGGEIAPAGARWHVVRDDREGAKSDYEVESWRGLVSARWQSASGLQLQAQAGLEFDRRHRFEDDEGFTVDRKADDAAFLGLRVDYQW
jgi:hypothetical protein